MGHSPANFTSESAIDFNAPLPSNFPPKKIRYSDAALNEFKDFILKKIKEAEADLELVKSAFSNQSENGTEDTHSSIKNYEDPTDSSGGATNQAILSKEKHLRDLKDALPRIADKTYGVCKVTGKLISKERLMLVPHATLSIEAKNMQR